MEKKKKQKEFQRESNGTGLRQSYDRLKEQFADHSRDIIDMVVSYDALTPDPDNRNADRDIDALAEDIMKVGNLIHSIFVQDLGNGKYMIKSGERRWRALGKIREMYPEEFKKKYENLSCRVAGKDVDELEIAAAVACGNLSAEAPTTEESLKAVEKIRETYLRKKERGDDVPDNMIEYIAALTNKAKRTIERTVAIVENLSDDLKKEVGKGNVTLKQAESLSGLTEAMQEKAAQVVAETGKLTDGTVSGLKAEDKRIKTENKNLFRNNANYEKTIQAAEDKERVGEELTEKEKAQVEKAKEKLKSNNEEIRRQITEVDNRRSEFEGALKKLRSSVGNLAKKKTEITLSDDDKTQLRKLAAQITEIAGE